MAGKHGGPGSKKPTRAQVQRRREYVIRQTQAGYSTVQIARALGVSTSTVQSDRDACRTDIGKVSPKKHFPPDPQAYDWEAEPARVAPRYRDSLLTRPAGLLEAWREDNALSMLAHAAIQAEDAGDSQWQKKAFTTLNGLLEYTGALLRVLDDPQYRRWAATASEARDDVGALFRGQR